MKKGDYMYLLTSFPHDELKLVEVLDTNKFVKNGIFIKDVEDGLIYSIIKDYLFEIPVFKFRKEN